MKHKDDRARMMDMLSDLIKVDSENMYSNEHLYVDKKGGKVVVGAYRIVSENGFYQIKKCDEVLYDGICLMDIALLLVEYHIIGASSVSVKKLLGLEQEYYKWKSDMTHYRAMSETAGGEHKFICEDRYINSMHRLNEVIEKIRICKKRQKFSWAG